MEKKTTNSLKEFVKCVLGLLMLAGITALIGGLIIAGDMRVRCIIGAFTLLVVLASIIFRNAIFSDHITGGN